MTPDQMGYVKCVRCRVWRRETETRGVTTGEASGHVCTDDAVCSRLAEVGKGTLEVTP
jgi:hypothetical protein